MATISAVLKIRSSETGGKKATYQLIRLRFRLKFQLSFSVKVLWAILELAPYAVLVIC